MKRPTSKGNRWDDHYTERARKEKYPARSVFKLQEMQRKFRLIKKGNRVLDLGCAPGSWLLYAAQLIGPSGSAVGVDLQPVAIRLPDNVTVFTGDVLSPSDALLTYFGQDFHAVLSDMAPSTTGQKTTDSARSYHLCQAALGIAVRFLLPGGVFVSKIFQGDEFPAYRNEVGAAFSKIRIFKPQSSRKASKEIFIIGIGKL